MNHRICVAALWGWASLASAQVSAAVDVAASEQDLLCEMPVVLSVSRLPQRRDDTPGSVTVIDRDMIRLAGARAGGL